MKNILALVLISIMGCGGELALNEEQMQEVTTTTDDAEVGGDVDVVENADEDPSLNDEDTDLTCDEDDVLPPQEENNLCDGDKVLICHHTKFDKHNICVNNHAVDAHLRQGDTVGLCD